MWVHQTVWMCFTSGGLCWTIVCCNHSELHAVYGNEKMSYIYMGTLLLPNPIHNSHTCKKNQEWHAQMATNGVNIVFKTKLFNVFSYSTTVDYSCLQPCLMATALN